MKTMKLAKMISFKILFISAVAIGLVIPFCEANILISTQKSKNEIYRMDLEIFKHVDRYYSVSRRAEVWEIYGEAKVKSAFNFFVKDDNVNELKHYMKFIATIGPFYDGNSLTLSYSILYTKYTAAFYAVNLLNIKHIKEKEFKLWYKDDSIKYELLKNNTGQLLKIYLKLAQYFAWYALAGNDVLQKEILEDIKKIPCAVEPYMEFVTSFNKFLSKLNENFFKRVYYYVTNEEDGLEKFWKSVYDESAEEIKTINKYFTAVLLGAPENKDIESNFLTTVQKENFIAKFASELSIMKGRDIDETFRNFDNRNKKEMFETNVVNTMKIIVDKEMELISGSSAVLENVRENRQYAVIQQSTSDEVYSCLKFELRDHETL